MRVAVNAEQLLYRSPGGIGRYTAQLLTVLPAQFPDCEMVPVTARHSRVDVDAALASAGAGAGVRDRVAIQALPRPLLYEGWVRSGRPRLRGTGPVTVVHAPSVAVPPAGRAPLVVTVHDAAPELFPDAFPRRGRRFHRLGLAAAARRADLVITVSEAAAEEIRAHSPIGEERIRVVPNGIVAAPVPADRRAQILARRGLADRPFVLWVGSLEPRKGVGTLVAAMAQLRRGGAHPETQTVLAGYDGWLGGGPIDAADVAALGPSLHQLGRVGEEELWALYAEAAVFAFPSLHEGFGLPVVEAMSQSTAVVASDIPALREVAGDAAVLVAPDRPGEWAAAIEGLLGDEAARSRQAARGAARSRLFDARRTAERTRAVYQEVGS